MTSSFSRRRQVWEDACDKGDVNAWSNYLRELPQCDLLPFVSDFGRLIDWDTGESMPLAPWLTAMFQAGARAVRARLYSNSIPMRERLALASFAALELRLAALIRRAASGGVDGREGAMIYYTDLLQCAILLSYEIEGEHLAITSAFAIPQPHAYLDPVQALSHAKSRSHVDLVKLLLASPQKLVGHRDVVVVVDRESHRGVFGPTIDTVYLSDWLYANYFIRGWFLDGIQSGRRVLEVGSGNGLLSSAFAKQGSRYNLKIDAVDVDCRAVDCTYRNIKRNAVAGFDMAQQCCLMVGHFDPNRHLGPFDFVVCNPPYIPEPFGNPRSPGAVPTHGTELLQLMVRAAPTLLADAAEMVMVSSRLSEPELLSAASSVPVVVELVASRRVPFDIQRMEPAHIQWLKQERGLEEVGGDFFHEIGIFRLRRVAIP